MKDDLETIEMIKFTTPDEFYENKEEIKEIYKTLSKKGKEIYKWYFFYELCMLKNPLKEMFWEYLNLDELDIYFVSNLSNQYLLFCRRRNRQAEIDKIE